MVAARHLRIMEEYAEKSSKFGNLQFNIWYCRRLDLSAIDDLFKIEPKTPNHIIKGLLTAERFKLFFGIHVFNSIALA